MARTALLNNIDHPNLRVVRRHGPETGANVNQVQVFPTEFADVQREYPILFRKGSEGDYQAVALLGLDKDENLFLDPTHHLGWRARYIPAVQERGPFLIGLSGQQGADNSNDDPKIMIDLDSPRLHESEGEPLFLPHGGNSRFLQHIVGVLRAIHLGAQLNEPMFAAFEEAGLIQPVAIEIKLDETLTYDMPDRYMISTDNLAALDGATLERLNRAGFLHLAYLAAFSLGNMGELIDMKNIKRAATR
jgi:hypothetical protein